MFARLSCTYEVAKKESTTSRGVYKHVRTYSEIHTGSHKKVSHLMFDSNFGKCGPIFKIISPGDS